MPRKYRNKNASTKKVLRLYEDKAFKEEKGSTDDFRQELVNDGNLIRGIDASSYNDIVYAIEERFNSAKDKTQEMAEKMDRWEKQYKGEWYTNQSEQQKEDLIFLRKTKEQVQVVYSHFISVINDLNPLVTFRPIISSMQEAMLEKDRALISEALVDYIITDLVRFKEDILPQWLKSFLKYSMGILKLTYIPDASRSDFRLENIDRSEIFIDPHAKSDIKNASWVIHRYGLPKREVLKRVRDGHYVLPPGVSETQIMGLPEYNNHSGTTTRISPRSLADSARLYTPLDEDELVEVLEYWQSPREGLSDVYAVMIGGIEGYCLRYGPNPYPYKSHPFFAKSYDPHELEVDGEGLVQELEDLQKILNTFLNMRIEDVRENMQSPIAVDERLVNDRTLEDFQNRSKLLRLDGDYIDSQRANNPSYTARNDVVEIPIRTSTETIYQDMQFFLSQAKENTGVSDAFAGNVMDRQVTATQYTNTLSRSTGRMRGPILQFASMMEEIYQAVHTFVKDPDFFGEERIIQILPGSKYRQIKEGWVNIDENTSIRSVSPDDMLVDGVMKAVSGFEDQINKSIASQEILTILQGVSLNPEMYQEFRKKIDTSELFKRWIATSKLPDVQSLFYTEEQIKQNEILEQQRIQQAEQQQIQMMQMQAQLKEREQEIKSLNKQSEDQNREISRTNAEITIDNVKSKNKLRTDVAINDAKIDKQTESDIFEMEREAQLEARVGRPVGTGNINE